MIPRFDMGKEFRCLWVRFLPPATKLGQGYVFTGVCDSVHRGGSASVHAGRHPPPRRPPAKETHPPPPTTAAAGGTHPTGMHSCFRFANTFFTINFFKENGK